MPPPTPPNIFNKKTYNLFSIRFCKKKKETRIKNKFRHARSQSLPQISDQRNKQKLTENKYYSSNNQNNTEVWATYSQKQVNIIKLFKSSKVNIAFRINNTIEKLTKIQPKTNIYNGGVCQLQCQSCPARHI